MLQPNEQWMWELDGTGRLTLDLGDDMLFQTPYKKRFLSEIIQQHAISFSLEDASFYEGFIEALSAYPQWSTGEKVQLALNATAVKGFYKPLIPKSWFYQTNPSPSYAELPQCSLVRLQTKVESGNCIVIDDTDNVVTTLLLDANLQIDDHNDIKQFEVIKVMKDRVFETIDLLTNSEQFSPSEKRVARAC